MNVAVKCCLIAMAVLSGYGVAAHRRHAAPASLPAHRAVSMTVEVKPGKANGGRAPAVACVTIRNDSAGPFEMSGSLEPWLISQFRLTVKRKDGTAVARTRYGVAVAPLADRPLKEGFYSTRGILLKPGEKQTVYITLNQLFDLSEPGEYTVAGVYRGSQFMGPQPPIALGPADFTIGTQMFRLRGANHGLPDGV